MTDRPTNSSTELEDWYNPMKHTLDQLRERMAFIRKRLKDVGEMSKLELTNKDEIEADLKRELEVLEKAEKIRTVFASDPGQVRETVSDSAKPASPKNATGPSESAKANPLVDVPEYKEETSVSGISPESEDGDAEVPEEILIKLDELDSAEEEIETLALKADKISNKSSTSELLSTAGQLSDKVTAYRTLTAALIELADKSPNVSERLLQIIEDSSERSALVEKLYTKRHGRLLLILTEIAEQESKKAPTEEAAPETKTPSELSNQEALRRPVADVLKGETPETENRTQSPEEKAPTEEEKLEVLLKRVGFTELEEKFDPILVEISGLKPGSDERKAKLMDFVIDYYASQGKVLGGAQNEAERELISQQFKIIDEALQEVWNDSFETKAKSETAESAGPDDLAHPTEELSALTPEERLEIESDAEETEKFLLQLMEEMSTAIENKLTKTWHAAESSKKPEPEKDDLYLEYEKALIEAESELSAALSGVEQNPKFRKYNDLLTRIKFALEQTRALRLRIEALRESRGSESHKKPESKEERLQNLKTRSSSILDQYFLAKVPEAKTLKHDKDYWEEVLATLISLVSAIDEIDEAGKEENEEIRAIAKYYIDIANFHKAVMEAERRNREDKNTYQGLLDEGAITLSDYEAVVGSLLEAKKMVDLADNEIDQIERLHRGDLSPKYSGPGGEEELRVEIYKRKETLRSIVERIENRQLWLKGLVDEAKEKLQKTREQKEKATDEALKQMGRNSEGRLKRIAGHVGKEFAETISDMALAAKKGMEKLGWKGRAGVSLALVGLAMTGSLLGGTTGAGLVAASSMGGLAMRMSSALAMSVVAHSVSGRFTDDKIWRGAAAIGGGVVSFFVLPEIVKYGMHESGLSDWLGSQFDHVRHWWNGDANLPDTPMVRPAGVGPSVHPGTSPHSITPVQPTVTPTHPVPPVQSAPASVIPTEGDFDIEPETEIPPARVGPSVDPTPALTAEKIPEMPPLPPKPIIQIEPPAPPEPKVATPIEASPTTTSPEPVVPAEPVPLAKPPVPAEALPHTAHPAPDVSRIGLDRLHYPETAIVGPEDSSWNYIRETLKASGVGSPREVENITGNIVRRIEFLGSNPSALHDTLEKIGKEGLKELNLTENSSYKEVLRALGYQGNNPSLRNIYDGAKAPNIKGLLKVVGGEEQLKRWVIHAHDLIMRAGLK